MNKNSILIIDDEPAIRKLLQITLESNDYHVISCENGKQGIIQAANHPPDLILLDLSLTDSSGHDILKELRTWYNKPIIILSVISDELDVVKALDNGATDYLTKPFRSAELLARIRSNIRRNQSQNYENKLTFGDLKIDLISRLVSVKDKTIKLTATEYQLLILLAKNEGRVLTHQYILKEIWGNGFKDETQYLRVFIGSLRKKIEPNHDVSTHIQTESGVGYRFI